MTTPPFPSDHEGDPLPLRLSMPPHTLVVALHALWVAREWEALGDLLNQARVAGYCMAFDDIEAMRLWENNRCLQWSGMLFPGEGYEEPKWVAILRPRVVMSLYHAVHHTANMGGGYPYREW